MREVEERRNPQNLRTDHVAIRSELKFLLGAQRAKWKCRVFGGKTGPFPTVQVIGVVRPVATVLFQVNPDPEPIREFGPVACTTVDNFSIKLIIEWHCSSVPLHS
jgi:hypothetical protein